MPEKSYIDEIRMKFQDLQDSHEDIDKELLYFPELIQLLCDMLDNDIVDKDSRILINAALGYLVVPNDIVPEDVYGPYGYMDDMYVACIVLGKLRDNYPDLINRLWSNDVSFSKVLDDCAYKSEKFLEEKNLKERLLRYCGLSD
jgi:uncharacterized membrane protein YkvA (DUF1232 family)